MTPGALKAPSLSPDSSKSPEIAPHRWSEEFSANRQFAALHDPQGHHEVGNFIIARRIAWADRPWQESAHSVLTTSWAAGVIEPGTPDVYVTQNCFYGYRRAIAHLKHLGAAYVDVDYRKRVKWADRRPEDVLWAAMRMLDDVNIPPPSYALSTGNGLCLVWAHSFVPRKALPRWTAVQRALAETLAEFGADQNALDAARVFRVVGSRNSRARDWRYETVRALYVRSSPDRLRGDAYQFDELASQVLPLGRADLISLGVERAKRRADRQEVGQSSPATYLTQATYAEAVLADLQRLRRHRHGDDGHLPPGHRDSWLFVASCAVAHLAPPAVLEREVVALAAEAGGWNERETRSRMSAVLRRAQAAARGKTILDPSGEPVDRRYRFRAATMVERLEITSAEMEAAGLRVLIDRDRRRVLNTERSRDSRHRRGAKSRSEAQGERLALGKRALYRQATQGDTIEVIALAEGVSTFQVSRAMREASGTI